MLRPEEISNLLKKEIEKYQGRLEQVDVGTVIKVGDSIATVYGLPGAKSGELLQFESGVLGMVMNLELETIGCVLLGPDDQVKEGDKVTRTEKVVEIPVGKELLGRVIDPLGNPLDGKGSIRMLKTRPIEFQAPKVLDRKPVSEPLETGLKAIDALVPIGRGQRELIVGDRQTGKTAIGIDTIINQKGKDVICIYVAIGQKANSVASTIEILEKYDALKYTIVVSAAANQPPALLYIAPYAGCAIGEEFMYNGKHVLIIYDDLSKHAVAYREISLLLRRPTGREAYPGDVFYLHSRLLERAAKLSDELGGGSMTALPIIETQLGDVSAYIPTNVISITDGQIYLDTDVFYRNIRPAIDVGLSVSRVGGSAQVKALKQVTGAMRMQLSQYRELSSFAKFSSDELDAASKAQLKRGSILTEILKQKQFCPMSTPEQVFVFFAVVNGFLDNVQTELIPQFEPKFLAFMKSNYSDLADNIEEERKLTDKIKEKLTKAIEKFMDIFAKTEDEEE